MKIEKIICSWLLFIFMILLIINSSYGAEEFKEGDTVYTNKKSFWYTAKQQVGVAGYTFEKTTENGKSNYFYKAGEELTIQAKREDRKTKTIYYEVIDKNGKVNHIHSKNLTKDKKTLPKDANGGEGSELSEKEKKKQQDKQDSVYQSPSIKSSEDSAESIDDVIEDAESFTRDGRIQYDKSALNNFSSTMFNIFSIIGAAVALIVGIIIGIKYMTGSIEEKADYKQLLVPYIVGCIVVFGAFGIWKLAITILEAV